MALQQGRRGGSAEVFVKQYVLFYDNRETDDFGFLEFQGTSYEWVFYIWDSLNPTTTITIVEV